MKLKKLGILLLAFTLCISFSQPASAEELNDNLRYGEREVVTVLKTEYVTTTVTPSGQLEGGTRFRTPGGLWVNTSGGPTVSVSLGVSWEIVNVSVSVGRASAESSVGGIYLEAPNNVDYFKARIDKTYKVEYKKIDLYRNIDYIETYYVTDPTLYSQVAYMEKV